MNAITFRIETPDKRSTIVFQFIEFLKAEARNLWLELHPERLTREKVKQFADGRRWLNRFLLMSYKNLSRLPPVPPRPENTKEALTSIPEKTLEILTSLYNECQYCSYTLNLDQIKKRILLCPRCNNLLFTPDHVEHVIQRRVDKMVEKRKNQTRDQHEQYKSSRQAWLDEEWKLYHEFFEANPLIAVHVEECMKADYLLHPRLYSQPPVDRRTNRFSLKLALFRMIVLRKSVSKLLFRKEYEFSKQKLHPSFAPGIDLDSLEFPAELTRFASTPCDALRLFALLMMTAQISFSVSSETVYVEEKSKNLEEIKSKTIEESKSSENGTKSDRSDSQAIPLSTATEAGNSKDCNAQPSATSSNQKEESASSESQNKSNAKTEKKEEKPKKIPLRIFHLQVSFNANFLYRTLFEFAGTRFKKSVKINSTQKLVSSNYGLITVPESSSPLSIVFPDEREQGSSPLITRRESRTTILLKELAQSLNTMVPNAFHVQEVEPLYDCRFDLSLLVQEAWNHFKKKYPKSAPKSRKIKSSKKESAGKRPSERDTKHHIGMRRKTRNRLIAGAASLVIVVLIILGVMYPYMGNVVEKYDTLRIDLTLWTSDEAQNYNPLSPVFDAILVVDMVPITENDEGGLVLGLYDTLLGKKEGYDSGLVWLNKCTDQDRDGIDDFTGERALSYGNSSDLYYNTCLMFQVRILDITKSSSPPLDPRIGLIIAVVSLFLVAIASSSMVYLIKKRDKSGRFSEFNSD